MEFAVISEEILAHFVGTSGTELSVRIEVEARRPDGFDADTVRTVSENAVQLKFDDAGFEDS